jgi:hypothetical protein
MTTRDIAALRQIMLNENETLPLRRCIEAALRLLDYEAPPETLEEVKEFLTSVVEREDTPVEFRLDALKLLRKVEARKIVPARATVRDDYNRVGQCRMMETLRRKASLIEVGCGHYHPAQGSGNLRSAVRRRQARQSRRHQHKGGCCNRSAQGRLFRSVRRVLSRRSCRNCSGPTGKNERIFSSKRSPRTSEVGVSCQGPPRGLSDSHQSLTRLRYTHLDIVLRKLIFEL